WVAALLPEILLTVLLFTVQIYDRAAKPVERNRLGLVTAWGAFTILLITLGVWLLGNEPNNPVLVWGGMIRHDLVALVFRVMFLTALMLTSLISMDVKRLQKIEYYLLLITATMGFSLMGAASDLIMIYLGLEMASISSYILAGFLKTDDRSAEAGLKYFVYGAFATGVMLYGMSLLYGVTGFTNLYEIGAFLQSGIVASDPEIAGLIDQNAVILLAAVMVIVGFGFKISAVPFHFWTPDVYEGAPTPFTAFVST
ncbi:MAG: NADH-quinone oxidoreductase subunit N, partial [Chloroflexi bacterium]|nr:NADH-quinone oxidoreductase subunit N [Chloroflexota bacterium]